MINLLFVFCVLFNWTPNTTGAQSEKYMVHVANAYGQIVEAAVVPDTLYCVKYEGAFRISTAGIDNEGRIGTFSEWSSLNFSVKGQEQIFYMADRLNLPILRYTLAYAPYLIRAWEDPHENNK